MPLGNPAARCINDMGPASLSIDAGWRVDAKSVRSVLCSPVLSPDLPEGKERRKQLQFVQPEERKESERGPSMPSIQRSRDARWESDAPATATASSLLSDLHLLSLSISLLMAIEVQQRSRARGHNAEGEPGPSLFVLSCFIQ